MSLADAFELAGTQIGLNEREQNAALQEYMANGGVNLDPAVTAWCAAFVNATLGQAGMQGTGALNARSFMDWGQPTEQPQRGDIAVFSRGDPNGWQGHVGFFDGYGDDGRVRVLGGNQGDAVSTAYYDASRLLGFRTAGENPGAAPLQPPAPGAPGAGRGAGLGFSGAAAGSPDRPDPGLAATFGFDTGALGAAPVGLPSLFGGGQPMMAQGPSRQEREADETQRRRQALFGAGGLADVYEQSAPNSAQNRVSQQRLFG